MDKKGKERQGGKDKGKKRVFRLKASQPPTRIKSPGSSSSTSRTDEVAAEGASAAGRSSSVDTAGQKVRVGLILYACRPFDISVQGRSGMCSNSTYVHHSRSVTTTAHDNSLVRDIASATYDAGRSRDTLRSFSFISENCQAHSQ